MEDFNHYYGHLNHYLVHAKVPDKIRYVHSKDIK